MLSPSSRPGRGRRITIVFNPVAGARRHRRLERLVTALDADGWHVAVVGTNGPGDATVLAAQAVRAGVDAIAAAGGDGTINEVVRGMHGSGVPLGIVPMGTANVLAAEFGLSRRPSEIASVFARGTVRRLHLPQVNGVPFLLMVGAGFDGRVVAMVTPPLKRRYGKAAFAGQGLRALAATVTSPLAIETDGVGHTADWAVVTNVSRYGGPYRIAPGANPGDASLTAVLFRSGLRAAMVGHLLRIGAGRVLPCAGISVVQASSIRIS
ncbi:MAG: diacylglycerol kinase family protein, partial [Rhodospirillaceae bacterium]